MEAPPKQASGGQLTRKSLPVRWNEGCLAWEARCPDCKQLAFMVTYEFMRLARVGGVKVPFLAPHMCPGLPCTCTTDPYNCPQGQALAQAIHDRKKAQGDDRVRSI